MNMENSSEYFEIRGGKTGFHELDRGLIAVWGKEAVQFLDGLISNDMKTLQDGQQMLAAFPNAKGRLIAVAKILRSGERIYIETDSATREMLFLSLFRFTFAGDFFVEDLSGEYRYLEMFGAEPPLSSGGLTFSRQGSVGYFVPLTIADRYIDDIAKTSLRMSSELYETLRIENGIPKFSVDMDESTIVPELGLDGLISYNKGCYVGQEIIARIHFRGHVAKRLTGLIISPSLSAAVGLQGIELHTNDDKSAGRITSVTTSPILHQIIALAYVRYEHLQPGTKLKAGESEVEVTALPFVK